jgi:hypothetical protein
MKMKRRILLLTLFLSSMVWSQNCSPYYKVKNWDVNQDVFATVSLISCFHAYGVATSIDWYDYSVGLHMMSKGHNGTVYGFVSYQYRPIRKVKLSAGPLYRINNDSGLLLGQYGGDVYIYKRVWLTGRVLQIRRGLNYLNVGLKVVI